MSQGEIFLSGYHLDLLIFMVITRCYKDKILSMTTVIIPFENIPNVYFNFLVNPDEIAVTRLFVYLKNTLDFDNLEDYLLEGNFFGGVDDEYVLSKLETHYRCDRLIKRIIKNRLCTEFVELLRGIPEQKHLYDKIADFKNNEMITTSTGRLK